MTDKRLRETVERITLTEEAGRRILDLGKKKRERDQRRKTVRRVILAVCMALLLAPGLSFLPKGSDQTPEWKITAYAGEADEAQWTLLRPGARVLLEKEPEAYGYRMELDLPEHYYYEKQVVTLGLDTIYFEGKTIIWHPFEEDTGLPDVMGTSMYIKILDEDRNEVDRFTLELTRVYDNCYVQIIKGEER